MVHEVQTNVAYQFRVQLSPANGYSCQCVKIEVNISRHSIQKWCMPTQLSTSSRFCAVQGKMMVYISQPTAVSQPTPVQTPPSSPSIATTDVNCDLPFVMSNITDIAVAHDDMSFVCCPESQSLFPLTPLPSVNEDEM